MRTIAAKLLGMMPWSRARAAGNRAQQTLPQPQQPPEGPVLKGQGVKGPGDAPGPVQHAGSEPGWLRVLPAEQLLALVQAEKAIAQIWRQSHQSQVIWERDLLPAIHLYAEFVQLMPASESHHHAHAGGLLSHTIEMLLAALTWRNAHLLPGGSQIEEIDAQRDQWTYVVFFAALLHDIAKPMTDLRIQWRCDGMADPVRWAPAGGSLVQIVGQRKAPEYLVDFAPKSQRDYGAHAKLAQLLLSRIAPESALRFLAYTPQALDALEKYLSGQDKDSLVAKIVRRADQLSTQRALKSGSKARFATAKAIPLIELLMQAMASMLRAGTELPLNRSGAAGWVYDGAIWFVAKRLADSVRDWIKSHEPDEGIPGAAKNDRLFDTWQEYGVLELNPATGQAIWHVTVHGNAADESGNGTEQGGYVHDLAMLRFPLAKLYPDASKYPAPMRGRLEIREKRKADEPGQEEAAAAIQLQIPAAVDTAQEAAADSHLQDTAAVEGGNKTKSAAAKKQPSEAAADPRKNASIIRAPTFNAPKPQAAAAALPKADAAVQPQKTGAAQSKQRKSAAASQPESVPAMSQPESVSASSQPEAGSGFHAGVPTPLKLDYEQIDQSEAAYLLSNDDFLEPFEAAPSFEKNRSKKRAPEKIQRTPAQGAAPLDQAFKAAAAPTHAPPAVPDTPMGRGELPETAAAAAARPPATADKPKPSSAPSIPPRSQSLSAEFRKGIMEIDDEVDFIPAFARRTTASREVTPTAPTEPQPVLLIQQLPRIQNDEDKPPPEPSELAMAFMAWVQESLVSRELKFNETGAAVHFVEQGMALVSPLIFKQYARTAEREPGDEDLPIDELAMKAQREVIKCGWHLPAANRINIVQYEIHSRGAVVGKLACVVLTNPGRWVQPVPPSNPALKMA